MKIMALRRLADRHSGAASRLRHEFRDHSRRSAKVAGRLLATPLGLSACFGLGAAAGIGTSTRAAANAANGRDRTSGRLKPLIGDVSTRLASALIVGILMKVGEHRSDESASRCA